MLKRGKLRVHDEMSLFEFDEMRGATERERDRERERERS
jgi:hypothetical protein